MKLETPEVFRLSPLSLGILVLVVLALIVFVLVVAIKAIKRAITKKQSPGKWDMPSAGHIDAGESPIQGCVRETEEELGIKCKPEDFVFLRQIVNQRGWELVQVYLLKTNMRAEDMKLQSEEVECVKWLKYDEFVKLFYSEEFCNHEKDYKDWVCDVLKNYI